jgi:hypothetical protein
LEKIEGFYYHCEAEYRNEEVCEFISIGNNDEVPGRFLVPARNQSVAVHKAEKG